MERFPSPRTRRAFRPTTSIRGAHYRENMVAISFYGVKLMVEIYRHRVTLKKRYGLLMTQQSKCHKEWQIFRDKG